MAISGRSKKTDTTNLRESKELRMDRFRSFEEQIVKPIQVLLVDDEVEFASIIAEILEDRGLKVTRAENGMDAAKVFAQSHWRFDLVISDVQMPELNGLEFLKFVRARSDIPFIVITGSIGIVASNNAYKLGATEFLPKPIKSEALLEAISHSLYCPLPKVAAAG
jgi:DNA-binding NtrC family response regulator